MSLKSILAKPFSSFVVKKTQKWAHNPVATQEKWLLKLCEEAQNTAFGKEHDLGSVRNHDDFKKRVKINDYEDLKPYIERIQQGETDVLWPGKPLYFAKTSGTTSGTKYIPLTKDSMPYHIEGARNLLLHYIHRSGNAHFVDGKMIFLQGSPEMTDSNGIKTGRLSGIVAHYVPKYLQANRMPSWEVNCIEDWEKKVDAIVEETMNQDMRLISGIPPWVQMYFERLIARTGKKTIKEIFPNFSAFVNGGVAYEPYRKKFEELIGGPVDVLELYPASEGFIAYQDDYKQKGMLITLDAGIFYEFIPADQFFEENPPRLHIGQVELGVNYVVILNTNAGLWGYNIGDTVQFVSKLPYRVVVSGRIKHFISAFGEHVIGSEVEYALQQAMKEHPCSVAEFTVAPQVNPAEGGLPYHEWFVEFEALPQNIGAFQAAVCKHLQEKNVYYKDLIAGKILKQAQIRPMKKGSFNAYMKSIGRLGGQNKLPRLSNDRKIADNLKVVD